MWRRRTAAKYCPHRVIFQNIPAFTKSSSCLSCWIISVSSSPRLRLSLSSYYVKRHMCAQRWWRSSEALKRNDVLPRAKKHTSKKGCRHWRWAVKVIRGDLRSAYKGGFFAPTLSYRGRPDLNSVMLAARVFEGDKRERLIWQLVTGIESINFPQQAYLHDTTFGRLCSRPGSGEPEQYGAGVTRSPDSSGDLFPPSLQPPSLKF